MRQKLPNPWHGLQVNSAHPPILRVSFFGTRSSGFAVDHVPDVCTGARQGLGHGPRSEAVGKVAAARRGKPQPRRVIEAMNNAWRGKAHTAEARRKMSEAQKRRGAWPPAAGRPWEPWEDELVRTLPRKVVSRQTGRTVAAVTSRRGTLGLPDGRRRENKPADTARD